MITTTLNDIRAHDPCADGWRNLLDHLGKAEPDDEPLPLLTILESNGLNDCLWALRCLGPEHHGWMRHYAVDCAEDVKHLLADQRSLNALVVARRYADGLATDEKLAAARDAAWDAAWAAQAAARAARLVQAERLKEYLTLGQRP